MRVPFPQTESAVVIVGAGPTGLMLAGELALAGVEPTILERRPHQELVGSRAGGLHSRTIEILDQRGIAERFLALGQTHEAALFADAVLDTGDLPSRHPYSLALFQKEIERILAGWVDELGVEIHYGQEVTGFSQDGSGVEVRLGDGGPLRAQYLVACDGGRSAIRRAAGIEFPGWDASISALIAAVEMAEKPELGLRYSSVGVSGIGPMGEGETLRVVIAEQELNSGEAGLDDLRRALDAVYGTDFGVHSPSWISRFTDATRQAADYRQGRVLLAGDSAHIHYPAGGQGLQHGIQDAVNLGWKLAQVVKGTSPDSLLDTYQAERHPATARGLRETMASTALQRGDARTTALRETLTELAALEEPRKRIAAERHGLDIRYDLGDGHPLLGRRMPDLDLVTAGGSLRTYSLLAQARPALVNFGNPAGIDIAPWADRVQLVDASYEGTWELPVQGEVSAPTAVLIRPDGHVAWVGDGTAEGLTEVLTTWFGSPAAQTTLR